MAIKLLTVKPVAAAVGVAFVWGITLLVAAAITLLVPVITGRG